MAFIINDECIACGACAEACPVEAIAEGDGKYVIDADKCIECGADIVIYSDFIVILNGFNRKLCTAVAVSVIKAGIGITVNCNIGCS